MKTSKRYIYRFIKRTCDLVVSLFGCIICIPIFIIISVIIKIDSHGPTFFRHTRIGHKGKPLGILKFRTMVENAEDLIKDFSPEQMKEWKEKYKLEDDPRLTRVGKILRKTSLDELPQIFDILVGKLSFIGPRPITEEEYLTHNVNKEKYTSVKPGLTGYWACNGRSDVDYEERIKLEYYYIENASLWLDIKVFFKTIFVVLSEKGAR